MSNPETSMSRRRFFDLAAAAAGVGRDQRRLGAQRRAARRQTTRFAWPDRLGQPRTIGGRAVRPELMPTSSTSPLRRLRDAARSGHPAAVGTAEGREDRRLRGLPAHPRSQGCRRRPHRDAGPLALPDADRRHRRRQGRLSSRSRCPTPSSVPSRRSAPTRRRTVSSSWARSSARGRTSRKPPRSSRTASSERSPMRSSSSAAAGYGTPPEPEAPVPRRAELGAVSGTGPEASVQAGTAALARLVGLRRRPHHRLGRPPHGRGAVVPQRAAGRSHS